MFWISWENVQYFTVFSFVCLFNSIELMLLFSLWHVAEGWKKQSKVSTVSTNVILANNFSATEYITPPRVTIKSIFWHVFPSFENRWENFPFRRTQARVKIETQSDNLCIYYARRPICVFAFVALDWIFFSIEEDDRGWKERVSMPMFIKSRRT